MTMGQRIRQARKAKGFTQEYIAEKLNVSRQAVFKWEKGQSRPDTENLIALAKLLGISVDALLGVMPQEKPQKKPGDKFFLAGLFPLALMPVCWMIGLLGGFYTDMVQIPIGKGIRMGIPFLMYGRSPAAIILLVVSIISFLIFLVLLFLGHQANKD